ncbi:hypothetical protein RvY_16261 [Ramazzottius varieornatus]|uniref:Chloride channel CLIC-like protein 1 n=1 Tax=Ramazzottius varieornatus TaxID=947166 RepID=A0A1D1VXU6_RAMVA|nr:hypothetical protein RvY_16261 [Ramazzottius varieornatus]
MERHKWFVTHLVVVLVQFVGQSWPADEAIRKTSKDVFEQRDESKWIDPQAKFALKDRKRPVDSSAGAVGDYDAGRREECNIDCSRNEVIMLRHVLRNFVSTVDASGKTGENFDVTVRIRRSQLEEFSRLLDMDSPIAATHSAPILDAWNSILKTMRMHRDPTSIESVENMFGVRLNLIFQVVAIVSLPILIIFLETKIRMSLMGIIRRILQYMLLLSFLLSFPWTWYRLYQEKVAEQQRGLLQKDSHCGPLSAAQMLKRSLGKIFSINPDASPCEKYYRAVNVDPFLDVPPTMAVAVTITNFVVEPLKHIGRAFGEFFQGILAPLPFYMWPFVIVFVLFVTFMLIIVKSGYRVHLPWFFARIEPGNQQSIPIRDTPRRGNSSPPRIEDGSRGKMSDRMPLPSSSKLFEAASESAKERSLVEERGPKMVAFQDEAESSHSKNGRSSRKKDTPSTGILKSRSDTERSNERSPLDFPDSD